MAKYRHALALNTHFGDSTAIMGVFPPTGLEYIAASMKGLVGQVTLLDLRYEKAYQDPEALGAFIRNEIDLLCISIRWASRFENACDLSPSCPRGLHGRGRLQGNGGSGVPVRPLPQYRHDCGEVRAKRSSNRSSRASLFRDICGLSYREKTEGSSTTKFILFPDLLPYSVSLPVHEDARLLPGEKRCSTHPPHVGYGTDNAGDVRLNASSAPSASIRSDRRGSTRSDPSNRSLKN